MTGIVLMDTFTDVLYIIDAVLIYLYNSKNWICKIRYQTDHDRLGVLIVKLRTQIILMCNIYRRRASVVQTLVIFAVL